MKGENFSYFSQEWRKGDLFHGGLWSRIASPKQDSGNGVSYGPAL